MYRLVILILLMTVVVSCSENEDKEVHERTDARKAVEAKRADVVRKLAEKHSALSDWDKGVIHYTVQLQEALVDSDRPVLFIGLINDVFKKDNQYYIRARKVWFQKIEPIETYLKNLDLTLKISFILKIDREEASDIVRRVQGVKLANSTTDTIGNDVPIFAIVAKLQQISKPELHISVKSSVDYVEEHAYGNISLDYVPSDTFVAVGQCIDLAHIGGDSFDQWLLQ